MADPPSSSSSSTSASSTPTLPAKMRAIVLTKPLVEPKGMVIVECTRPSPEAGQILVKVKCFGLNFADTIGRKGQYEDAPPYPYIPGYECSGVVVGVGTGVTKFKIGDKVFAFSIKFGCYAQYVVASETTSAIIPANMSFADAASIPVVFATAYHCICGIGPVYKGDKVLIHAAAGGVGLAAVQIAKLNGLVIYGTASREDKIKMLKEEYGVDHVINYRTHDFVSEIHRIEKTTNPSIDLIIDSIGGAYFKKELPLIRPGGKLAGIGAAIVQDRSLSNSLSLLSNVVSMVTFNLIDMLYGSKSFVGVNMKRFAEARPQAIQVYLDQLLTLFADGKLKTFVTKVYEWTQVNEAHKDIESRGTTGKLVLRVEADDV